MIESRAVDSWRLLLKAFRDLIVLIALEFLGRATYMGLLGPEKGPKD